jgi:hypothetical protein
MARNDSFSAESTGLANGDDFIIDGSSAGTGAVEIFEMGGSGSADVYREIDPDDDTTFEVSVLIEKLSAPWHSQKNQLVVSRSNNVRIRINNTSGGTADFFVTGMEVDD